MGSHIDLRERHGAREAWNRLIELLGDLKGCGRSPRGDRIGRLASR